jgi:co-chaperonin GroES (HSP10)
MTIKPIWSNLLVSPIKKETVSASWLILSTQEEQRVSKGEVISIGKWVDEEISIGDVVHFPIYSPDELEVWDEKFLIINQKSILWVEK